MSTTGGAAITTKVGRNDACPCGSGRKFKHCCGAHEARAGFAAGTPWAPEPPDAVRQRLERLLLEAKRHFDARRWDEAIALFREIVRYDPNNPQAHHDLGMIWLFSGRPAEAAASLERAVELKPGFDSALGHLATALLQQGREGEALLAYRRLGRSADDPAARRFYLALALKMEGRPEEAEKELARSGAADGQGAGSPRGALVGPWDVRGGRGPIWRRRPRISGPPFSNWPW